MAANSFWSESKAGGDGDRMSAKVSATWDVPSYYHVLAQNTWLCSEERGTAEGVGKRQRGGGRGSLSPSDSLSNPFMNKAPLGLLPTPSQAGAPENRAPCAGLLGPRPTCFRHCQPNLSFPSMAPWSTPRPCSSIDAIVEL